jgi:hypothetical protein
LDRIAKRSAAFFNPKPQSETAIERYGYPYRHSLRHCLRDWLFVSVCESARGVVVRPRLPNEKAGVYECGDDRVELRAI